MATTDKQCDLPRSESKVSAGTGQVQRFDQTHDKHRTRDTMVGVQERARNAASEVASTAKEQGQRFASQAKEKTASFLADRQHQAASKIDGVAEAARRAAETLRQQGDENVASYAETAADQVAALSHYLRDRRPKDLLRDLEDAAARHPAVVYGGLFLAGLALSRFLKASERSHAHRSDPNDTSYL